MFKISTKILVSQFRFLLNLCIRTHTFPTKWKNTVVTPLHKSGNPNDPGNYRPIACVLLPSKILEKCIHSQLYNYLENSHQLSDTQFGFRKSKNTTQAIFKYLDHIYTSINNNQNTLSVYVDFRKAFDTVDHKILLTKLKNYNLSDNSIAPFENYLSGRTEQVFTNKRLSDSHKITTGVPQGSTLGPLLFIMYINSLPSILNNSQCLLFADDTVIFHSSDKFDVSFNKLQTDLNLLHNWCRLNKLEVNASKTKLSYFTSKFLNSTTKPYKKLILGHSPLDYVSEYKYLGLTIYTKLNFKKHLVNTLKSVSHKAYQLNKIRHSLSAKTALQSYKTMILPIIDYGDIFLQNKSSKYMSKLQTIQNRCIRTISKLPRLTNTKEEEKMLELLPLNERRALHTLQFAHELTINEKTLFTNTTTLQSQRATTRAMNPERHQFKIFRPTKTLTEKSISYCMRKAWNRLPTSATITKYLLVNPEYLFF